MGGEELGGKTTGEGMRGILAVGGEEGITVPNRASFRMTGRDFVGVSAVASDSLSLTDATYALHKSILT